MTDGSDGFFRDGKLSYPDADRLVSRYLEAKAPQRTHMTSSHVIDWGEAEQSTHNQKRVHDALSRVCEPQETNARGRTVFKLPRDYADQ